MKRTTRSGGSVSWTCSTKILALTLTLTSASATVPGAHAASRYELRVSRSEARDSLNGLLDELRRSNPSEGGDAYVLDVARARKLISSIRLEGANGTTVSEDPDQAPRKTRDIKIHASAYPDALIASTLNELYPQLYDQVYAEQYQKIVVELPLEVLYDGLLSLILDHKVPDSMKGVAESVGTCWAKKAAAGKSESCELDTSETVRRPSKAKLAWVRVFCPIVTPCQARKTLFDEAKPQLVAAKSDPAIRESVRQVFEESFPRDFRNQFSSQLVGYRDRFPQVLPAKFGERVSLWDAPLLELGDHKKYLGTSEFAAGIKADIQAAAVLAKSEDPEDRAWVGPLLYAAANRILLATGGRKAKWGKQGLEFDPADQFDPANPKRAPVFVTENFGGWALGKTGSGSFAFFPWEWGGYDPLKGFRLFAARFGLSPRGEAVFNADAKESNLQKLGDLAELLSALSDFLVATSPSGPLGKHFGELDLNRLFSPDDPLVFPRQGRQIAIGMIAGVAQNIIAEGIGHLEMLPPGEGTGFGLVFHDRVEMTQQSAQRSNDPARTREVAQLIVAAANLRAALLYDPDTPDSFKELQPKINSLLQAGAMTLQGRNGAMGDDGGFYEQIGKRSSDPRLLMTTVAGLRAMTRAYEVSGISILRLSSWLSWRFLDRFWPEGQGGDPSIPIPEEGSVRRPLQPSEAWELLRLWRETQPKMRPDLRDDIDWPLWEARFNRLRAVLSEQLDTRYGPEPLSR